MDVMLAFMVILTMMVVMNCFREVVGVQEVKKGTTNGTLEYSTIYWQGGGQVAINENRLIFSGGIDFFLLGGSLTPF